jgi:hypothetical protein
MTLLEQAKDLYYNQHKNLGEVADALGIPVEEANRLVHYSRTARSTEGENIVNENHTFESLMAVDEKALNVAIKKAQGSRVEWCDYSPEYGNGEHGENRGWYFFLKGMSSATNHTPYFTEEEAWECWGNADLLDLLDEMACNLQSDFWPIPHSDYSSIRFLIGEFKIPGKPSESFPKAVYIAYILWKQEKTA